MLILDLLRIKGTLCKSSTILFKGNINSPKTRVYDMILTKIKIYIKWTIVHTMVGIVSYAKINNLCWIALINLISTGDLTLVFLVTRTLDLNFVDIVWTICSCIKHKKIDNIQINSRASLKSIRSSSP